MGLQTVRGSPIKNVKGTFQSQMEQKAEGGSLIMSTGSILLEWAYSFGGCHHPWTSDSLFFNLSM
jgi:hypothetical protein